MKYDLLIRNGTIIDGTGAPRFVGDIGINDGCISAVGEGLDGSGTNEVIDASGLVVAPGNIDTHAHYDAQINWDPYCTNTGWHGGSTVVVSNCGFGFMPCRASDRDRYMKMMENTEQVPPEAMRSALPWNWEAFPEWMAHMKSIPKGLNVATYLPINSLMIYVMGYEAAKSRPATPVELEEMGRLLNEAMDHGAIGFAFSHLQDQNTHRDCDGTPMPTDSMHVEDLYYFADILKQRGEGVIQALVEIPKIEFRSIAEELARRSGRPVVHNVVAAFDMLPDYHEGILGWLDECADKGLEIYSQSFTLRLWNELDAHTFTAWDHIPPFLEFCHVGDYEAKTALASNPEFRARARDQYKPENMVDGGGPVETLKLLHANGADDWQQFEGMRLGEIAKEKAMTGIDVFFEIVASSKCKAEFKTTEALSHDPEKVTAILSHPRVLPGTSDGGAHIKFNVGGHYPTDQIIWLVRELGTMTLEEMHYKQAALPAKVVGLSDRGTLEKGKAADLYIYDFDELGYNRDRYEKIYDLPGGDWSRTLRSQGIHYSIVNGQVIFREGETTGNYPGRMVSNTLNRKD